ncbi:MAG: DUF5694 domain-containing protein [Pseudomonadota bacterium]
MLKPVAALIALVSLSGVALAAEPSIEVMVLGSYHFGNPGQDVNNVRVDSVLVPKKQAELDALARALLTFKPTKVMVEVESDAPDFAVQEYTDFTPEKLKTAADETNQIGYRVAHLAGLKIVHGIDEQPKYGEPDYFPYVAMQDVAKQHGQTGVMDAANLPVKAYLTKFEADQKTKTVADLLIGVNADAIYTKIAVEYSYLKIGDKDDQAGADLNAMWYLRNAKIFGKLMQVAKPGDRVLVVYGAGHNYWLRHFATETPGYKFVDPVPYLKATKP